MKKYRIVERREGESVWYTVQEKGAWELYLFWRTWETQFASSESLPYPLRFKTRDEAVAAVSQQKEQDAQVRSKKIVG
jgi:hypothetical protein